MNQTSEPQDSADHSRQYEEELVDDEFLAATEDVPEEHHQEETQVVNETEEPHDEEGHVDVDAAENAQPQATIATEKVTSTKPRSKEDLALLKQNDPIGYRNAIVESMENSSDPSHDASTASGKSTSTSPLDDVLKKVKAQFFKRDLMKALEGDPTAQSCLGAVLGAVDLLAVSPEISSFILELYSIIDQVSADYNRRRGFNSQLETLHGKSSSAWTEVAESTSRIAELSKQSVA